MRLQWVGAALVAVVVLGMSGPSLQAQDAAKGASLLAEARKAIGGEDKVAAVKRLQANGEFKRAAGNNTLEGEFEIFIEPPDKYRLNEETGIPGGPTVERTQILNGTEIIDQTSGGGPGGFGRGGGFGGGRGGRGRFGGDAQDPQGGARQGNQPQIDPERLKEAQRRQRQADLSRYLLVWLLSTDQPVSWLGTAQSPDGTADVLQVTPQGGTPLRLFLDTSTHMPLMVTWEGGGGGRFGGGGGGRGRAAANPPGAAAAPPADGQAAAGGRDQASGDQAQARGRRGGPATPVTNELHLAEYKVVNGIKLPHLITRSINGQTLEEMTVKSYKVNPNFKANTFTK